ncbi:MAG: GGDEF domain-containing protein [Deltaproteobacteria bacterium]|nr:MAG: GGDEF domain-containing protein [Deltaproteobacteria bacterium]
MTPNDLLHAVFSSDELPTLPTVASKLITLTAREETTLADIADLVSKDVSLSAKILKVANSSFYSFPQQIGSIQQAVSILGINAVRSLVLSFSFLTIKGGKKKSLFNFENFWEKSLASAVASKLILEKVKGACTDEVFISGLLQNLGELIFARTFREEYDQLLQDIKENQHDAITAEERAFGGSHCFIGHEVAKKWGFPERLLLPILYHQNPHEYKGKDKHISQTIKAVYLSDLIVNIIYSDTPDQYHKQFLKEAKKLLALSSEDIEDIFSGVHLHVKEAGEYFGLKIKKTRSIQEILQEANIRLSLLNLDYDQMNKELIKAKIELETLAKDLEEKNKILANLANVDGLTEVYNHRYFQNALEQEISRAIRNEGLVSLIFTDIDHFKKFNDKYGHQVGDFILKEFCKIIQDNIRKYDILARYGGEEFAVILPETGGEDALGVAEKLRLVIEEHIFDDGREEYRVTASFGVASCKPAVVDDFSKNDLISQADTALYEAKGGGRNQAVIFAAKKKKWYSF